MYKFLFAVSIASLPGLTQAHDFAEGQIWSYKTRPGEERSTLLIDRVDADARYGSIYHISITGVAVKNSRVPSGVTSDLPHFPVSKETLEKSCTTLVGNSAPNPDYRNGYDEWKRAFDKGEAGIFTASVSEIVDIVEKAINQ